MMSQGAQSMRCVFWGRGREKRNLCLDPIKFQWTGRQHGQRERRIEFSRYVMYFLTVCEPYDCHQGLRSPMLSKMN